MFRRELPRILKATISFVFVAILVFKADATTLLTGVKRTDAALFCAALFLSALAITIRSYKWQLLLSLHGARIPLSVIESLNYKALFFNNFFLGSLGGDTFKIYRTLSYPTTKGGSVAAVLVERLTGILMLFLIVSVFCVVALFTNFHIFTHDVLYLILSLNLLIITLICSAIKYSDKLLSLGARLPLAARFTDIILLNLNIHKTHGRVFLGCLSLSLVYYCIAIAAMHLYASSVGAAIGLWNLTFIVPTAMFLTMLPVSINGLGVQESAFVFYFERIGTDPSLSLIVAFLPRIGMYIFSVIGGILYLIDCSQNRN
jgi:uncharacterized protein (TIRG00374 family)